ncbi:uncharacterized protein AMSG_04130 [Thecamonas trahens ATCC 50062]|uniref:dCMP deaminase n=1 Tax=Thecamonas trahens ATCC 50062 TaxID=461836 RepID=A0A0L0D6C0_THETB|nr:hypothetical protein AMSG_04130 [Thecamonas trahens ATCC 50062]KNC47899.1 hypothetical protein AMSG_04130 [Thecamonas trahens ATCC 50062]|eukprot:XP_013758921.1 hypothetical protein AMSG_04130 [Thecamonas trahens ATCC 50062]
MSGAARWALCAVVAALRSKDSAADVGCVFVDPTETRLLSLSYNGFPKTRGGPFGDPEIALRMYKARFIAGTVSALLLKRHFVIHSEVNGLVHMAKHAFVRGLVCYVTLIPCHDCVRRLVAAGVARVTYLFENGKYGYDTSVHGVAEAEHGMAITQLAGRDRAALLETLAVSEDELRRLLFGTREAPVGHSMSWIRTLGTLAHAISARRSGSSSACVLVSDNYAIIATGVAEAAQPGAPSSPSAVESAVFANPTAGGVACFVTQVPLAADVLLLAQYGVQDIFLSCPMPHARAFPRQAGLSPPDIDFASTASLLGAMLKDDLERDVILKLTEVLGLRLQFLAWESPRESDACVEVHISRLRDVIRQRADRVGIALAADAETGSASGAE